MKRGSPKPKTGLIAALDIGTTKVCCFIAQVESAGNIRVVGIGHQKARGLRAGAVVDMDLAEESIRGAVHAAEQMAGETIREAFVNLTCGAPSSQTVAIEVSIAGHEVGDSDLRRVLGQGMLYHEASDREIIHSIPVNYTIDGSRGIRDPRGMYGERLGVNMHVVSASAGPVRNLKTCVARGHLELQALVVSPYAAALSTLVEDEMDLGVTCIDMGGGVTSIAVFLDGEVIYTECIPIGGQHVTSDIARGLSTPLVHAERMKTLYGSTLATSADEHEVIDVPQVGEDEHAIPNHVPKSILVGIIQPRLEETFELARSRLEASGLDKVAGRRVVLTGGASQLQGVRELAALILDKQVRMGRPLRLGGLADATAGPAFATCAGLLHYAVTRYSDAPSRARRGEGEEAGMFGRLGSWLRENL
ncbi:MAG TPA: cell division protein FtsA [Alphaproteobacteria bacterium]|nr:cell division protein FtsA [Alphaproteobacteria bacterium]